MFPHYFYAAAAGLLGLVLGSFMNVLIYRLPRGMNIAYPPSRCVRCGKKIRWRDNIPVVSFLLLKGRCSSCGERISLVYPAAEILTAAVFAATYLEFGPGTEFFKYSIMSYILLAAAFTDISTSAGGDEFETGVIPVIYPAAGALAALTFAFFEGSFEDSLAGWGAGYLVLLVPAWIYSAVRGREGMGDGDFLLLACAGAFLGPYAVPAVLTLSALFGVAAGIVIVMRTGDSRYPAPFAPMIAAAAIIYVFFKGALSVPF